MDANGSEFFRSSLLVPFARGEQSLEWNTSLMETGTTRQATVDQRYMSSKLCSADRRNVAARSRTEYEYVNCRGNISDYHTISSF
jgi:hypothetical protein